MSIPETKILVLDANQLSSLAVIRSLSKIQNTAILTADSLNTSIGGSSNCSKKYFKYPSISNHPLEFLSWIEKFLTSENIDIVFPCTEISSQILLMNVEVLKNVNIPFSSIETIMRLANKCDLTLLAESIGVKTPESLHFKNTDDVNIEKISNYPVVVKPSLSHIWCEDHWLSTVVKIVRNRKELKNILESTLWLKEHPFMIQEYIEGYGVGIFALYNKGKPITFFSHKRVRENPPDGGVSVLSKTNSIDPFILRSSKRILESVNWHGVAMVEYRMSTDGTPYLMEVNTRFWGSLQLAIDSGVNFPVLLYQLTMEDRIGSETKVNRSVKLRWLLGDLMSLYAVLKSTEYTYKYKLIRTLNFLTPHIFTTRHQVGRYNDWKPALEEFRQFIRKIQRRLQSKDSNPKMH